MYLVRTADELSEVTFTLDTSAYAVGDLLADTQELAGAARSDGTSIVQNVVLLDGDDNGGALDLLFLEDVTSIGTENAALDISDAVAAKIQGVVEIISTDYTDLANSQVATLENLGILIEPASGTSIGVAAISRDTMTYSADGLVLKVGLLVG